MKDCDPARAKCLFEDFTVMLLNRGSLLLVGVGPSKRPSAVRKIVNMRIFSDEGKMACILMARFPSTAYALRATKGIDQFLQELWPDMVSQLYDAQPILVSSCLCRKRTFFGADMLIMTDSDHYLDTKNR